MGPSSFGSEFLFANFAPLRETLFLLISRLLGSAAAAAGGGDQALRHVGQCVAHDGESGHVLAEIVWVHLVQGVGLGVMPVEVVRAHGALAQAGNAIAQQRSDIAATTAAGDFAGADAVEQFGDLLQRVQGAPPPPGANPREPRAPPILFEGRGWFFVFAPDNPGETPPAAPA